MYMVSTNHNARLAELNILNANIFFSEFQNLSNAHNYDFSFILLHKNQLKSL